jgi:hypothetical protein
VTKETPISPDLRRIIQRAKLEAEQVRQHKLRMDEAREQRDMWIRAMLNLGMSERAVARVVGLESPRINQIRHAA